MKQPHSKFANILGISVLVLMTGLLLYRGFDFYLLSLGERVAHADRRVLGPGGSFGHGYGVFGTILIIVNLLYLLRRKIPNFTHLGRMNFWLDIHMLTGVGGGLFVLFHSAFQLRTLIATINAASLFVVIVTGWVGYVFYAITPKNRRLEEKMVELERLMPDMAISIRQVLALPASPIPVNASVFMKLFTIATSRRRIHERRDEVCRKLLAIKAQALPQEHSTDVDRLIADTSILSGRQVEVAGIDAVLRSWRNFHRFLVFILIFFTPIHIVVAWIYGFRWIWSQ